MSPGVTKDLEMNGAKLLQSKAQACASHGALAAAQVPNNVKLPGFARELVRSRSSSEATAEELRFQDESSHAYSP